MLNDQPRDKSYVFVTWITKLISGEDRCWWKAWYKAHFAYVKRADALCESCAKKDGSPCADPKGCRSSFFREYQEKHDRITTKRVEFHRSRGAVLKVEKDGQFKVRGKNGAILSGIPDLVALYPNNVVRVEDAKAGKRRDSDRWQVKVYQWALPLSWLRNVAAKIAGAVAYTDGVVEVGALTTADAEKIGTALRIVTGSESPSAEPSRMECQFCDVADCPSRYVDESTEGDASDYF